MGINIHGRSNLSKIKPSEIKKPKTPIFSPILVTAESFNWFLKTFRVNFLFKTDIKNSAIYVDGIRYPTEWLSRKTLFDRRSIVYIEDLNHKIKNMFLTSFLEYLVENKLPYLQKRCIPSEIIALPLSIFKRYAYQYFNNEIIDFVALVDSRFITRFSDIPEQTVTGLIILINGYAYPPNNDNLSRPQSVAKILGLTLV